MKLNSQSMRFVMEAMMETAQAWIRDKMLGNDTSMNIDPSAPMIIQVGDYGYEVQSCGGDGDIEGFVIMCKPEPVCVWAGMECIKLGEQASYYNTHDFAQAIEAKLKEKNG